MTMPDQTSWMPSPPPGPDAGAVRSGGSTADTLLPQSLSGVFDEAFDLYKRHFTTLALIFALIYLPAQILLDALNYTWLQPLIQDSASRGSNDPAAVFIVLGGLGVYITLFTLALAIASGPIAAAVSDSYLQRRITVRESYRNGLRHGLRLMGGWAMVGLAFIGVYFLVLIVLLILLGLIVNALGFTGNSTPLVLSSVFVIAMFLVPYALGCAVLAKSYAFTAQLVVLEDLPVAAIPARNAQLVGKTRFRRTFGAIFSLPILVCGLMGLISFSIRHTLEAFFHLSGLPLFLAQRASWAAVGLFLLPYSMIFLTLLYYDYRVRREGLDVRILSSNLPLPEPNHDAR